MPILQLAVREVKLEIGSHEWDRYGVLVLSYGKTIKRCPPSYCESPFITKWGNARKRKPLALFTAQSLSHLFDSTVGVDIYTGPLEQGPFERLFGRSEFYLSGLKIKQQHELLHLSCSVYDPLRRETNVRHCPRMILKCTWFYKEPVPHQLPSAPLVSAPVEDEHIHALELPAAPSPSRRHSWPPSSHIRPPLAPLPHTRVSNVVNVNANGNARALNKPSPGTNVDTCDRKLVGHVSRENIGCIRKSQEACGGSVVEQNLVVDMKDRPKVAFAVGASVRPKVRIKKFAPEKRELKETLKLLLDGVALMRDLANK